MSGISCGVCGASLDGLRSGALYCSGKCRAEASRRRNAAALSASDAPAGTSTPAAPGIRTETARALVRAAVVEPAAAVGPIPRVCLTREEAATSLGISLDSFERHVQPDVRLIRRGSLRLVPVSELERWASESAELTLQPNRMEA